MMLRSIKTNRNQQGTLRPAGFIFINFPEARKTAGGFFQTEKMHFAEDTPQKTIMFPRFVHMYRKKERNGAILRMALR